MSIEETDVFTGKVEKAFCFRIYYYEWERQDLLTAVIGLGKYAYVKRSDEEECNNFIEQMLSVIRRGKEITV